MGEFDGDRDNDLMQRKAALERAAKAARESGDTATAKSKGGEAKRIKTELRTRNEQRQDKKR